MFKKLNRLLALDARIALLCVARVTYYNRCRGDQTGRGCVNRRVIIFNLNVFMNHPSRSDMIFNRV